jgi:DNA-binding LytR/AlgR family response regulator
MNVVIIEDEHLSAVRLAEMLLEIDPGIRIVAMPDSVKSATRWFSQNEGPDLLFVDIQLGDGLSFDIFDQVRIDCPVIFTTAYQEYAIRAFRVNSVDYLLKPIHEDDLRTALAKYRKVHDIKRSVAPMGKDLLQEIRQMITSPFKSRFMVKVGDRIRTIEVKDILYFFSFEKGTFLHAADGRNYAIDFTLDALGEVLDPFTFHRINRRYIITHAAIADLITLSGSKLKVILSHADDEDIYVSRDRLQQFKEWLDQ